MYVASNQTKKIAIVVKKLQKKKLLYLHLNR
jgi:hypothetical protein